MRKVIRRGNSSVIYEYPRRKTLKSLEKNKDRKTRRSETSQYPEEKNSKEIS